MYNSLNETGNEELVAYVSCNQNNYVFERTYNGEMLKGRVWISVKELRNDVNVYQHQSKKSNDINKDNIGNFNKYILHQGDIIKLGRIELKVRSIRLDGNKHKPLSLLTKKSRTKTSSLNLYNDTEQNNNNNNNNQYKRTCRICFGEDELESPLINPCKCAGGVKYIHLHCLQQWLKTKRVARSSSNENCSTYTYKKISCELCKTILPDFVQSGNGFYEVWKFSEPEQMNYIVFESLENIHQNNNTTFKTIYVVNFSNKSTIKIGRSHEVDLRIRDVTVSRLHATLELLNINNNNEIVLRDNKSKFGSIVELQCDKIPLYGEPGLTLQLGKNLVNFTVRTKANVLGCMSCGSERLVKKDVDYNRLNNENIDIRRVFTVKDEKIDNSIEDEEYNRQDTQSEGNKGKDDDDDDDELEQDIENDIEVRITTNQDFNLREKNRDYFGLTTCGNEINNENENSQIKTKGNNSNNNTNTNQNPIRLVKKTSNNNKISSPCRNVSIEVKEDNKNEDEDTIKNPLSLYNNNIVAKKNIDEQEDKETFAQDLLYSINQKENSALMTALAVHK